MFIFHLMVGSSDHATGEGLDLRIMANRCLLVLLLFFIRSLHSYMLIYTRESILPFIAHPPLCLALGRIIIWRNGIGQVEDQTLVREDERDGEGKRRKGPPFLLFYS